jgi:small subunit ribosomal protein S11
LTNKKGEVISWSSAGKMGFRGSKRTLRSPNGSRDCSKVVLKQDLKKVKVYVRVQETDVSLLSVFGGIEVTEIIDVTQCNNGCRPQKDVEFNNIFSITR